MNKLTKKRENKKLILLFLIFLIGFFLRFYQLSERFYYGHDHDLLSWFVKDVLLDNHIRLIGQETSTKGIFIGPLYYYLQIPFYLLFRMDPIALAVFSSLFGIFGIFSSYYVISKLFDENTGLISAFLYSVSFYAVNNDREAVMTMPVIIWSVWYFYSLNLIREKQFKKGFLLFGILTGLIWHLNATLVLLLPLVVIALYAAKKKVVFSQIKNGLLAFVLLVSPFVIFELKHGFIQVRSFIESMTKSQGDIYTGLEKLRRVAYLINKNIVSFFWGADLISEFFFGIIIVLLLLLFLLAKKKIDRFKFIVLSLWLFIYFVFFSSYSKVASEYYFNGLFVVYLVLLSRFLAYLLKIKPLNLLVWIFVLAYSYFNISNFIFGYNTNNKNYKQKKALVSSIKSDMNENDYDCSSVSYITEPGYEFGYRYFFSWLGIKTKEISNKVPVYTIVFPLNKDGVAVDDYFGSLGLIYPDHKLYSLSEVNKNCQGEDYNAKEPMWGLPK